MFTGTHELSIDDKGRFAVPARFRQPLLESCGAQLVLTMGPNECVEIYPVPQFQRVVADIEAMENRDDAEVLKQWFIGFAVETAMDPQGRILLPPMLRKRAKLGGPAMLMGQNTRFDLWAADLWEERFSEQSALRTALPAAFRSLKR